MKDKKGDTRLDIAGVSAVTGLSSHTIRAWEKRYAVVRPSRRGNRRTYATRDIDRLTALRDLVSRGFSIGVVARMSPEELTAALLQQGVRRDLLAEQRRDLLAHVEGYELEALSERLRALRIKRSTEEFLIDLICPLLSEVGRLVEEGRLGVAQEHALSALVHEQLNRMRAKRVRPGLPTIAFCTPEGDHHDLGILIGAKLAASKGFPVLYFGANLPAGALVDVLRARRPDLVVIGATAIAGNLKGIEDYLRGSIDRAAYRAKTWIAGPLADTLKRRYRPIQSFREFASAIDLMVAEDGI